MIELVPPGSSTIHRAVESVLETLMNGNTALPTHVLIDEGDRSWLRLAAAWPVEVRRRTVLVTASDESLVDALSLEIGGAVRLPVSTPSMEAACESAAALDAAEAVPMATQGVLDTLVVESSEVLVVGWWPQAFWQRQMGPIRPVKWLVEIAERLAIIPVILPGPILFVAGRRRAEIEAVWIGAEDRPGPLSFASAPRILEFSPSVISVDGEVRIDLVLSATAAGQDDAVAQLEINHPVLEIPSGRRVGCWSLSRRTADDGSPWHAVPRRGEGGGRWWEIVSADGSSELIAESTSLDLDDIEGQRVIRVPGFFGAASRSGSPAGLLIEGLARDAGRAGRPIWVPGVDGDGVRFLLGLPGPIWVDGPGVPG